MKHSQSEVLYVYREVPDECVIATSVPRLRLCGAQIVANSGDNHNPSRYLIFLFISYQPGLFLDFNFYHRQPLSGVTTGSLVHCGEHIADTMSAAAVTNSCRPSVLLLLMQSQTSRSLSSCMLDQYYNSSTFLRCLKTETDSGGAVCISAALNKCYSSLDIENQLTVPSDLLGQSMLFLGSLSQNISQDWYLPPPASDLARMITDTSQRLKPYKHTSNITCHRYRSFNSQSTLEIIP